MGEGTAVEILFAPTCGGGSCPVLGKRGIITRPSDSGGERRPTGYLVHFEEGEKKNCPSGTGDDNFSSSRQCFFYSNQIIPWVDHI
jgi:hypothetical protein